MKFSPSLDCLESRALQAVVSLSGGVLSCYSDPDPNGGLTSTDVFYNPNDVTELVVISGSDTYFFNVSNVSSIRFFSSTDGGDFFINSTDISSIGYLQGADNVFVGGSAND